jgi:hypothetical protein
MRKFWTGSARFLAFLACVGFVLTAFLALVLTGTDRRLFDPATYKNALASRQVYARMPRILAEQVSMQIDFNPCAENPLLCENVPTEFQDCARNALGVDRYDALISGKQPTADDLSRLQPCVDQYGVGPDNSPGGEQAAGPPAFMRSLTVTNWENIIAALFPPDELKGMAETVLDQVFAYLDGKQDVVSLSLVDLKTRISGRAGMNVILDLIRSQPPCSDQQLEDMRAALNGGEGDVIQCRPPDDALADMTPQIQAQLQLVAAQIPDEAILLNPDSGENSDQTGPLGGGLMGGVRVVRLVMKLSPDLPLFFLLFVSLFAVRTPKSWLRWWGIPFLAAGLVTAGTAISSPAAFEEAWLTFLSSRIPAYITLGTVGLGHDLLQAIFGSLMASIRNGGILLGLLGAVMWAGSFFIKSKADPAPPTD